MLNKYLISSITSSVVDFVAEVIRYIAETRFGRI